jgi:hypothetical protein
VLVLDVANLKQDWQAVGGRIARGPGHLEQTGADEEHDAAARPAAPFAEHG